MAYLEKRGILGAVEHFKLGFANRTLGLRLPEKNRQAGEAIRARLQTVGVVRESGHEHLNGCVVFPWFDESGAVAGLYGRKIGERLRSGTAYHLYLPGPRRGVFNAQGVRAQKEVIVCEANRIVHEVLGRSLDELPPVTRRVLDQIVEAVKASPLPRESVRFSRREVRSWTGQSDTQLKLHLSRLAELEYLLIHRAARGQGFEYELIYDGGDRQAQGDSRGHASGEADRFSLSCH